MECFFWKNAVSVFIKLPLFHSFSRFSDCKDFFLIIYGIGKKRLENLQKHYKKNGILPRVHGNKGRLAIRVCSLETLKPVVSFLDNYAEEHAVAFPGRVPGFKRTDVRLLPSSNTKASIHRVYEQAAPSAGVTAVLYPKFVEMWNKLRPKRKITKPMTDLCHTCQKNNTSIYRSANLPDDEKSEVVRKQEKHLLDAEWERSLYKNACNESKDSIAKILHEIDFNSTRQPCSFNGKVHYSFDYANATISYLHYFFANHGLGETEVLLHADNCCRQNKNSYVLWYLAWWVMVGLHQSCTYSFLIVGHPKFACDWCFGLLKQSFRKSFAPRCTN